MADEIRLSVGGKTYSGWESVEIVRSIEAVCASFSLSVADPDTGSGRRAIRIAPGARAEIHVGQDLLLSGYVDAIEARLEAKDHSVRIEGRDLAGDLVDCVPLGLPSEFYDVEILDLARELAAPFGVDVELQDGVDPGRPFEIFSLRPTETAFEALERAIRARGLLAQSTADGTIVLSRAGSERASVEIAEGKNLYAVDRLRLDHSGRFRRYVVLGQRPGSDLAYGADVAEIQAEASDPIPRATRTLAIQAEGSVDDDAAAVLAVWWANVRAARGSSLVLSVQGWRQGGDRGLVWRPGVLVPVKIPRLEILSDWLVAGVRLSRSIRSGSVASLALVLPDSYLQEPPSPDREPAFGSELEE